MWIIIVIKQMPICSNWFQRTLNIYISLGISKYFHNMHLEVKLWIIIVVKQMPICSNWSQRTPNIYTSLGHIFLWLIYVSVFTSKIYKYREKCIFNLVDYEGKEKLIGHFIVLIHRFNHFNIFSSFIFCQFQPIHFFHSL